MPDVKTSVWSFLPFPCHSFTCLGDWELQTSICSGVPNQSWRCSCTCSCLFTSALYRVRVPAKTLQYKVVPRSSVGRIFQYILQWQQVSQPFANKAVSDLSTDRVICLHSDWMTDICPFPLLLVECIVWTVQFSAFCHIYLFLKCLTISLQK